MLRAVLPKNPVFVVCLGVPFELLHPSLQSAPKTTANVGGCGNDGSLGITTFGDIGANDIAVGKVGILAALGAKFKSTLFTTFGLIPALNSKSTIGSGTGCVLAIPY